ncbi:serine/threonine protein kinase [Streptomyces macrosporus]|uniref:serine/threonine protein kinase n=1 Tax=Streptomyces macrosporus TaxID=44032 RepID=UPI0031D3DE75
MDDYSGRLLADRYRLPRPPSDEYELVESRAYDTASGQEVMVRQVPLPEVVEAEFVGGGTGRTGGYGRAYTGRATRRPADPTVRRAVEAALAASRIPDHPRLDQVFDVFVEGDGLWIVSELVAARPLAAVLAEKPLSPHRAAELAADLLTALRAVHAHGWVHRNITPRTVLVCDDGRAVLTGLAAGAAEEALCGYDPLPAPPSVLPRGRLPEEPPGPSDPPGPPGEGPERFHAGVPRQTSGSGPGGPGADTGDLPALPEGYRREGGDRAARSGAIAAYRAGTRAAAARAEVEARRAEEYAPDDRWGADNLSPVVPGARGDDGGAAEAEPPAPRWDAEDGDRYRGPTTALAAERARQARIAIVGAVTERWAPEQAGPVYENWRLAPPVGPAADLWALGALLFRAVQGHPPYPEESAAELTQMVCAEPPAFAEECGALRPVVESLLRQDPTERPDFEELGGWLRSLIRSAPEPEVGRHTVTAPLSLEAGGAADPKRLPIVRRRGELVRRKRAERAPVPARARHRRARKERSPRRLGCALVGLVLLLLTGTLVYAALFMPGADTGSSVAPGDQRAGRVGTGPEQPDRTTPPPSPEPSEPQGSATASPGTRKPQTTEPAQGLDGYLRHEDDRGFQIAVPEGWRRSGPNGSGQIVFRGQGVELVVVPGRDTTEEYGDDPMAYLTGEQPELDAYRAAEWATSSGMRRIEVGRTVMAEGRFSWTDGGGDTYVRDRAIVIDGRYHTVLVRGPENRKDTVDRHFEAVADTYRFTG